MRALVTGAGGFVGAHLAARLVADGWEVVGSVRPGGSGWRLDALGLTGSIDVIPTDLSVGAVTADLGARSECDVAFLLAASRAGADAAERAATTAVNGTSGRWLVDALPACCRAVVRLGSSTEYARCDEPMDESAPLRPRSFFGTTKAEGSRQVAAAAAERDLRATILRAFQVYGPLDHPGRLVPAAFRAARTGAVLPLTQPGQCRDWVHVDDVVEACVLAATADTLPAGQVLNIGTGRQVSNEVLVAHIGRAARRPVRVDIGAHPGRAWDAPSWVADPRLATRLLGWRAEVGLEDGLSRTWAAEQILRVPAPNGRSGPGPPALAGRSGPGPPALAGRSGPGHGRWRPA